MPVAHRRLVAALCVSHILWMSGFGVLPAVLPDLIDAWQLSGTRAGWLTGIYFAGYTLAVPVLVSLTDRVDPRRILGASLVLSAAAAFGFAALADGLWSALGLRFLAGIGLAGSYMPGLKALTDHIEGPRRSRAVATYTAMFGFGVALSYLACGEAARWLGWPGAFWTAGALSALALAVVWLAVPPAPPAHRPDGHLLDFRPVLRNRAAMGYVLAYGVHCWELFAARSWVVAFLAFALALEADRPAWLHATTIATAISVLGVGASILGNELAVRLGRRRAIGAVLAATAVAACAVGWSATAGLTAVVILVIVHGVAIMGDSGTLNAGVVEAAAASRRGATMAVHSTVGFAAAALGALVFGVILDAFGGGGQPVAWAAAFASLALCWPAGALALRLTGDRPHRSA